MSGLRVFGLQAFVHIPDKHHGKLAAKSLVCMPLATRGIDTLTASYTVLPNASLSHTALHSMRGTEPQTDMHVDIAVVVVGACAACNSHQRSAPKWPHCGQVSLIVDLLASGNMSANSMYSETRRE